MNKIKILAFATFLAVAAGTPSCNQDFDEMNVNPNTSRAATPESLLAPALHNVVVNNLDRALRIGNELMQVHVTTNNSREFHRYNIRPSESDFMWRNWYLQLTNFRDMYESAAFTQQPAYKTYMGMSLILDAWVTSLITDMYGDVPYFEANKGKEGILTPKFDKQQAIYTDLFRKLEEANKLLSETTDLPDEVKPLDPLYNGSMLAWRKFGNSMYLRLLMRVSGRPEMNVGDKIKDIVETSKAKYPIMESNAESAVLRFTTTPPLTSEFFNYRDLDFNGDKGYTDFFINNLNAWTDPRREKWATLAGGTYMGIQSGYPIGQTPERQSYPKIELKNEPLLGNILNYAEVQFILAEAALRGYVTTPAKTYYDKGVENAITFWGLALPAGHLEKEDVKWNENETFEQKLEAIHLQKYYTLFFTDFQQWYEYRRTGHPILPTGSGLMNNGQMPSRLRYPINVQALNAANYQAAVAAMGGPDDINTKVWWDQ
ncbi:MULTISPECIES: SusD/RagB family nutrient-binding outer membrane lipoprotein [Rufibacter]|uniref:SusD/RagB family nutrient-binding outer membrane lipoprotein n=1 Tax=Rufibacter quisquiliarum TaxID=1549639 RepID=A0A839GQF6_9BACT|nr:MULTISPECIES: SusD/RagB family nutrient-binding outer membrane lipoprotein [Rufibacter]MBA9076658.1 hypothetical protein [Rufibacter quisquiliarum]